MIVVSANDKVQEIGKQVENIRTQVAFPLADIMEEFPGGNAVLIVQRAGETDGRAVSTTEIVDTDLVWTVEAYDLENKGLLKAQVIYTLGNVVAKTKIYCFRVTESLLADAEEPSGWSDWVNTLVQAAANVNTAISDAEDTLDEKVAAAQAAQTAAENAQGAAEDAQADAEAAQTASEAAQTAAETARDNASNYATNALSSAQSAAASATTAASRASEASGYSAFAVAAQNRAEGYSEDAEAWATGTRNGAAIGMSDDAYHNNARYYAESISEAAASAQTYAGNASASATAAQTARTGAETAAQSASDSATAAANTNATVQNAKDAAVAAQASAEAAATSASTSEVNAEAWAVGERNGTAVTSGDLTYHNNAKFYSDLAQQGAQEAGYVFFTIDDSDGNLYVTTTDNIGQSAVFEIDESTGNLEVTVNG